MKHFVGYHNVERMEQESEEEAIEMEDDQEGTHDEVDDDNEDDGGYPYGFVTRKKPDRFIGNVIWGIQGQGKPRDYFLIQWFIVDAAEQIDDERFTVWLRGLRGISIPNEIYLNDQSWFPNFRAVNSNFSLGLQEIAPKFLDEICRLVKGTGLPLPPDCDARIPSVQLYSEGEANRGDTPATTEGGQSPFNPPPIEPGQTAPDRRFVTEARIIRDTAVTAEVKRLHNFCCQVCGARLETPAGPYAEGAHIRPLGSPHDGPDTFDNVLCLCPNHHALFDRGAFSVGTNMQLIGIEGRLRTESQHPISEYHLRHHRERFGLTGH